MAPLIAPLAGPLTALWAAVPPGDSDPASGQGPEWGKAAPIGLLVWLLLGLALFLLIKSLNRNLRKVPASFEPDEEAAEQGTADAAPGSASANGAEDIVTAGGDDAPGGGHPPDGAAADGVVGRAGTA